MANATKSTSRPIDPVVAAYLADVDETLIRKNLQLSVEDRFLQLMELQRFARELRNATRTTRPE